MPVSYCPDISAQQHTRSVRRRTYLPMKQASLPRPGTFRFPIHPVMLTFGIIVLKDHSPDYINACRFPVRFPAIPVFFSRSESVLRRSGTVKNPRMIPFHLRIPPIHIQHRCRKPLIGIFYPAACDRAPRWDHHHTGPSRRRRAPYRYPPAYLPGGTKPGTACNMPSGLNKQH